MVSVYHTLHKAYRAVMHGKEALLLYEKVRPCLVGEGVRSLRELLIEALAQPTPLGSQGTKLPALDLSYCPAEGEAVPWAWKHNLSQGARACLAHEALLAKELHSLARQGAVALRTSFAAIDTVLAGRKAPGYHVLEGNSGVVLEEFMESKSPRGPWPSSVIKRSS